MSRTPRTIILALLVGCLGPTSSLAATTWTVDASLSFLKLAIPTQPAVLPGGISTGNASFRTQGNTAWIAGSEAPISGTLSTDWESGNYIKFRGGEHALMALDSGSYAPDPANWNAGTQVYSPSNGVASGVFGAQVNTSQTGPLLLGLTDALRFAIRDVLYDLSSGTIPVPLNQFSSAATTFAMTDAEMGVRGRTVGVVDPLVIPSYLGTADELGFELGGTNAAAMATISLDSGMWKLTLPINVPLTWSIFGNEFTGTAQGTIVATTAVPEPGTFMLGLLGGSVALVAFRGARRRRSA